MKVRVKLARHKLREKMKNQEELEVRIPVGAVSLKGHLTLPKKTKGVVVFAHGTGSSRFSPRNRFVAQVLNQTGLGTLLLDLLTKEEEREDLQTGYLRFDIELLAQRLIAATQWLRQNPKIKNLTLGYFGASTGAAAALIAAAQLPQEIKAVVSRGGRPDLAEAILKEVEAPTLLIVGAKDYPVLGLNQQALTQLTKLRHKKLVIVSGATHLFEEPGALEAVARLACRWFKKHLCESTWEVEPP